MFSILATRCEVDVSSNGKDTKVDNQVLIPRYSRYSTLLDERFKVLPTKDGSKGHLVRLKLV